MSLKVKVEYDMFFTEDYRGNSNIWFEPAQERDECTEDDRLYGTITVIPADANSYYIYMVYLGNNTYKLMSNLVLKSDQKTDLLLQIHSHINGCTPFQFTGFTSSYKQTGSYGDPIQVTNKDILKMNPDQYTDSMPCAAIIVDDKGDITDVLSISPLA